MAELFDPQNLTTIAKNQYRVYDAGYVKGKAEGDALPDASEAYTDDLTLVTQDGEWVISDEPVATRSELEQTTGSNGRRISALEKDVYNIDDYAYAICDDNGNIVFAITNDGEVLYSGKDESAPSTTGSTTINLRKCGLPVLYLNGNTSAMRETKNEVTLTYTLDTAKASYTGKHIASGTCKCKLQGSSSIRKGYPKRNYTIKLDAAVEATDALSSKEGVEDHKTWGAQKKYCLKANWIDPSAARNVVCAKLWGEVVASRAKSKVVSAVTDLRATSPNYGAVDGFPCILIINNAFEGLYTFNIPKDGWTFNMGDGTAEYLVGGENNSKSACGFYSTPTFEPDANGNLDFDVEHIPEDVAKETLVASFQTAVNAAKNASNSSAWETAVAPYFDIDSAIDYYIFTCCISGHDNLRKNILYGTYDGKKWFMSAYDLDTTFGFNPYGSALFPVETERTQFYEAAYGSTRHRLFELIYKYSKDKLKARYLELRGSVLSDENVWYAFNNFVTHIPRVIYNMDAEKWADQKDGQFWGMPATTTANVENYIQYYRMHCALLDKELGG